MKTTRLRSCLGTSSTSPVAWTTILPRPVAYALRIPSDPQMCAPVGKSGPFTCSINSSTVASGFLVRVITASHTSATLCGGMFVAIPTAMPDAPLTKRFGRSAGNTVGSLSDWSKFSCQSTVSFSMSPSMYSVIGANRHSVYLIAAGGSPSTLP